MTQLDHQILLQHLRNETSFFVLRRKASTPERRLSRLHVSSCQGDAELYALSSLAPGVSAEQRVNVLYQLLASSRAGLAEEARRVIDRVLQQLVLALPTEKVLTVFLALRKSRANHKHATRLIVRYLLNHPKLEELATQRRPTLVDCLEHALGKNVVRACARYLSEETNPGYVQRHLLRFADHPERAETALLFLYGKGPRPVPPVSVVSEASALKGEVATASRPRTITATNRGDIAATLVHMYQGGTNNQLVEALHGYVEQAAASLPRFEGKVALVLDASASTLGYGEREYCCISQSQALRLIMEKCCAKLRIHQVGGTNDPLCPRPEGYTDLSTAVLDALEDNPDVLAVVTDGYENVTEGDLARVLVSLAGAGVDTPVVFCHSKFTGKDDLSLRRPGVPIPELEFWHQEDFAELLWGLFAQARAPVGQDFVRASLRQRLLNLEKEGNTWISKS